MPVRHYGSRPISGEVPHQGPDAFRGRNLNFVLNANGFEALLSSSTGFTFGTSSDNFLNLNLHASTRTGAVISERQNGFIDIS